MLVYKNFIAAKTKVFWQPNGLAATIHKYLSGMCSHFYTPPKKLIYQYYLEQKDYGGTILYRKDVIWNMQIILTVDS